MKIKGLCRPASFYFYLSLVGIILSIIQNMRNFDNSRYKCGSFSVVVPSVMLIFAFKILYVVFWTYIINLLCKDNNMRLAWLIVLFPIILFFVILGMLMLTGGSEGAAKKEGFREGAANKADEDEEEEQETSQDRE
jgi:hypothetical protein